MQYKPNLQENQVNASSVLAKGYEDDIVFWPKNPKANFLNGKMNISYAITKHYENARLRGREKPKPNQTQFKANQTQSNPNLCHGYFRGKKMLPAVSRESRCIGTTEAISINEIQDTRYKIRDTRYEILSMNNEQ